MTSPKPLRADAQRNRARILSAAEQVFAERGASASTEEVAVRAEVAIGTVFRHFPTKEALLAAIMKELRQRLIDEAEALLADGDPATAFYDYFTLLVERSAAIKTVVGLLAERGTAIEPGEQIAALTQAIGELLAKAQRAGAVRPDARLDEVIALVTATSHGALQAGWDEDLRTRTLALVFDGLRPRHR